MNHIDELRAKATRGDAQAQCELGVMYRDGNGVKRNYDTAFWWFLKASERGSVEAQYQAGEMYWAGQGTMQDYGEALKHYRKAAEQGSVNAQRKLGEMYTRGVGVEYDANEARKWYRKAAEQGNEYAQEARLAGKAKPSSGGLAAQPRRTVIATASAITLAPTMNALADALLRVQNDFGMGIINDAKRLNAVLADYAPKMVKERKLLIRAVEEGAVAQLRRGDSVQQCAHMLVTELYITEDAARGVVEVLARAINTKS